MSKKIEANTDLWVYDLLKEAGITPTAQGSSILEIDKALKTASKKKNGEKGSPEYIATVKDFLLVIEDKKDTTLHVKRNENNLIAQDINGTINYALNGALHYGLHLIKNTSYKKILAFGISGDEKRHRITPIFINERGEYKELEDVETFTLFNEKNIEEYYIQSVVKEKTTQEKTTEEILKDAKVLHKDLRDYGSIQDKDKPLIVSGILLALNEVKFGSFSINTLTGDSMKTDGEKI